MTPQLVVLHGWGQSKENWEAFASQMTDYPVTRLDFPGFGREPLVSAEWGVPEYAAWVEEKFAGAAPGSIVLLGHSFGGRVAAYLAHKKPSWLRGLILYGAPLLYRPSSEVQSKIFLAKFLKSVVPTKLRTALKHDELKAADASGLGTIYRRTISFDQGETLGDIHVPVLMVWGSKDEEAPLSVAREAATRIPNAHFEVLPGAGHNAHLEQPLLFYGIVTRFLKSL